MQKDDSTQFENSIFIVLWWQARDEELADFKLCKGIDKTRDGSTRYGDGFCRVLGKADPLPWRGDICHSENKIIVKQD